MALKDITGARFGLLLVIERAENKQDGSAMWKCCCECGARRIIAGTGLRAGRHKSCGCASPLYTRERVMTHGKSTSRIYRIWIGMIVRCSNKSVGKDRKNYFEKGIRVCDRWMKFENFLADMGEPEKHLTLDRKDGSQGYSKENCRWSTNKEQANNMSTNRIIQHDGMSATIAEWSEKLGMKANTLEYRILRGWSASRALTQPIQTRMKRERPQGYLAGE